MNTCTRYAAKVYRVVQPRRTIRHVCLYRGAVHRVTSRTRGAPIAHVTLAEMYVHQLRVRAYTQCRCNRLLAPLPPVPLGIQYSRSPCILFHDYAPISRLNISLLPRPLGIPCRLFELYRSCDDFTTARGTPQ